jgi:hypothetical protein
MDQHPASWRRAIWIGLLLILIAAPAQANRIVQIRVGNHPSFTRLVFEMDAFAGYQVERRVGTDGVEQLTVTLEASTPAREITSKSVGIESVKIAEGVDQAIAQIRLRKPGLQMTEMILSNPPRIVLDFVHSAAAIAEMTGDPYAKPTPVEPLIHAEPAPAVVRPEPKPVVTKAVKPKPEPKPVVTKAVKPKPEPKPVVTKAVKPKPEPKPVVTKAVKPKREPKPVVAKVVRPKSVPSKEEMGAIDSAQGAGESESSKAAKAKSREDLRASIPGVHKRHKKKHRIDPAADSPAGEAAGADVAEVQIADAADANVVDPLGSRKRAPTTATDKTPRRAAKSSDVTRQVEKPKPADSGLPFSTVTLVGIAVGALIVLVVAVRLLRRRSLPNDLDVTTFADESDDDAAVFDRGTSERIPARRFSMGDSPTDGPVPPVEEQNTAAYSLSEVAADATEPETGLYNDDSEGEKPMDMDTNNLPTERDKIGVPPVAVMSGGDNDMSELVQELAGRIANLETRLDEANDSRERLERQVAAQSEELRVQRAAIARTQRALRSLSRSEEDQATEPALREPSQPAR